MPQKTSPEKFLEMSEKFPVIDVRTPAEYSHAHIPGAVNIPLFTDEERARIGTLYKHEGKTVAVQNGLKAVGPKLYQFTKAAMKLGSDKLLVHCWRGGMRSASMAWLFETVDLECFLLEGGYKAYRNHILDGFAKKQKIILLGGMTGSGKTEILAMLRDKGEQVIDLEGLASHKGSAFGSMGQNPQPTTEQFENDLFREWMALDPDRPVWLEDESRNIGKVFIPQQLWDSMRQSPLVRIDTDIETRVRRLVRDYTCFDTETITASVRKIEKRLGREKCREAEQACIEGDMEKAVRICLAYYDKLYTSQLENRSLADAPAVRITDLEMTDAVTEIIEKGYRSLE